MAEVRSPLAKPTTSLRGSLRTFEEAHTRRSIVGLRAAYHDEALVESFASEGRALGPDATVEAIGLSLEDEFFELGDWSYEELGSSTALLVTGIRYHVTDAHIRHLTVHRLISGKEGLIWRVKLFHTRGDALAHFEKHGPDLGMSLPQAHTASAPPRTRSRRRLGTSEG